MESLLHATQCKNSGCRQARCWRMKRAITHASKCNKRGVNGCCIRQILVCLCLKHSKRCPGAGCAVPFCPILKQKLQLSKLIHGMATTGGLQPVNSASNNNAMAQPNQEQPLAETCQVDAGTDFGKTKPPPEM